ncbi:MAG: NAD-dependent epimerase/dehydratase family protein [Chloroflexota bacterium]|nr:NAD-dependent epimerase/dehydratase family protein [Chloroflexota bacterium]
MRCLILGGSRFLGLSLVRDLVALDLEITVFNRGTRPDSILPGATRTVHGDRDSFSDLQRIADIYFDVVFDFSGYTSKQASLVIDRFRNKVGHYVYCSTAAVYAQTEVFPLTENSSLGLWPLWGKYGQEKLASEQVLRQAWVDFHFPLTVIRPVYILGPANYLDRESFILKRLLTGAPILIPGDGNALIQFVFVQEVVQALILISQQPDCSIGNAYNCCGDEFITLNGLVRLFAEIAQVEAHIVHVKLENFGISLVPYDAEDIFPFSNSHFICSNSKLKSELGFDSFQTLRSGVKGLCEWYQQNVDLCSLERSEREKHILSALAPAL